MTADVGDATVTEFFAPQIYRPQPSQPPAFVFLAFRTADGGTMQLQLLPQSLDSLIRAADAIRAHGAGRAPS